MKYFAFSALLLLALFAASLLISQRVSTVTDALCETLALSLAAPDGAEAERSLTEAQRLWEAHHGTLHLVFTHAVLDDVDRAFARARCYAAARERPELSAELAALIASLRMLAEQQALSLRNIL